MPPETTDNPEGATPAPVSPVPVPPEVLQAVKGAFHPPVAKSLAVLVFDSLVDDDAPRESHVLRFEHPDATIELRLSVTDAETVVHGDSTQNGDGKAILHRRDADHAVVSEVRGGEFEFGPVDHGLVRISVAPANPSSAGEEIWTDWFRI
jgi:hypothetical protein